VMKKIDFTYIIFYSVLSILIAIAFYLVTKSLVPLSTSVLVLDSALIGIILGVLVFILQNIIEYANYILLPTPQRIVNYSALAILFVLCWIGFGYLFLYMLLPEKDFLSFVPLLPVRIFIAILVYISLVLFFINRFSIKEVEMENVISEPIVMNEQETPVRTVEILERIAVKNGQKIDVILVEEAICLLAEGDYVMIHSGKGKFLKEQTMKYFEQNLPSNKFVRVHRSSIVNVDFVAKIELYDKQSQLLKLQNGQQVKMSITGYRTLKKILGL